MTDRLVTLARMSKHTAGLTALALAAVLTTATGARADTIVFNNTLQAGSQQNFLLGMDFTVNNAVTVTQLGAFDDLGNGFANTITVGIFDLGGTLQGTSASLTGTGGTLVGGSRFTAVAPFVLNPGTYSIVAAGYTTTGSGTDLSGNSGLGGISSFNNAGGDISLITGGGRWNDVNLAFALPTEHVGGYLQSDPVFEAGTFAVSDLTSSAVPDGGSASMLLGFGVMALGFLRRMVK